jgi:hypothetical protein
MTSSALLVAAYGSVVFGSQRPPGEASAACAETPPDHQSATPKLNAGDSWNICSGAPEERPDLPFIEAGE